MKKQPVTDKVSQDARTKILESAKSLFIEYGFAGTSISAIAKQAGVTRSLIFHHYSTKDKLWVAVKQDLLESGAAKTTLHKTNDINDQAQHIISTLVTERFEFYNKYQEYFRLTCWQVLDRQTAGVGFGDAEFYSDFKKLINSMQSAGQVDKNLDPKVLLVALIGSVYAPFMLEQQLPLNKAQKKQYLQLMQNSFRSILSNSI